MKISERDSKVLIVIVVLLVGAFVWTFIASPVITQYDDLTESLDSAQTAYMESKEILDRRQEIELAYRRVEATFPVDDANRRPRDAFQEDVEAAVEELLPGQQKKVDLPMEEDINKNITDYRKLYLEVRTSGDFTKISQLLKGFDQKGFLINSLSLQQAKGIDNPEMDLQLRLDRIVKVENENVSGQRSTRRSGNLGGYSR